MKRVVIPALLLLITIVAKAQLPQNLLLTNPMINGDLAAAGGIVWKTADKSVFFSAPSTVTLGNESFFYSDDTKTYLLSRTDHTPIATIADVGLHYDIKSGLLWKYDAGHYKAYDETGSAVVDLTISGATFIYPYADAVRYVKGTKVYKNTYAAPAETELGSFVGTFSSSTYPIHETGWFVDGERFFTNSGATIKVYTKDAVLLKTLTFDINSLRNIAGTGENILTIESNAMIYDLDQNLLQTYNPSGGITDMFVSYRTVAYPLFGAAFGFIDLQDPGLTPVTIDGPDPGNYNPPTSFNADLDGNWIAASDTGPILFGDLAGDYDYLTTGVVRDIYGDRNGNVAVATSAGTVIVYDFDGTNFTATDTLAANAARVKMSLDGTTTAVVKNDHKSIVAYNTHDGTIAQTITGDPDFAPTGLNVSEDGTAVAYLTSALPGSVTQTLDGSPRVLLGSSANLTPVISPDGAHVATIEVHANAHPPTNVSSVFEVSSHDETDLNGIVATWIDNNSFIFARLDSTPCNTFGCKKYYTNVIRTIDGNETVIPLPVEIDPDESDPKLFPIDRAQKISATEFLVREGTVLDITNGKILYQFDTVPRSIGIAGPDHLVYVSNNKVTSINWRAQSVLMHRWFLDNDHDTFGDRNRVKLAVYQPQGYVADSTDCVDNDLSIHLRIWYNDADGDTFGNPADSLVQCDQPEGYVADNTDCQDDDATVHLVTWYRDLDGDGHGDYSSALPIIQCDQPEGGYVSNNDDCFDYDPDKSPDVTWYIDKDRDNFGDPNGPTQPGCDVNTSVNNYVPNADDCDDNDANVHDDCGSITGLEDPLQSEVFPNPGTGVYFIPHHQKKMDFTVIGTTGQQIKAAVSGGEELYTIDISGVSPGLYVLKISSEGKTRSLKIIRR